MLSDKGQAAMTDMRAGDEYLGYVCDHLIKELGSIVASSVRHGAVAMALPQDCIAEILDNLSISARYRKLALAVYLEVLLVKNRRECPEV